MIITLNELIKMADSKGVDFGMPIMIYDDRSGQEVPVDMAYVDDEDLGKERYITISINNYCA